MYVIPTGKRLSGLDMGVALGKKAKVKEKNLDIRKRFGYACYTSENVLDASKQWKRVFRLHAKHP